MQRKIHQNIWVEGLGDGTADGLSDGEMLGLGLGTNEGTVDGDTDTDGLVLSSAEGQMAHYLVYCLVQQTIKVRKWPDLLLFGLK